MCCAMTTVFAPVRYFGLKVPVVSRVLYVVLTGTVSTLPPLLFLLLSLFRQSCRVFMFLYFFLRR